MLFWLKEEEMSHQELTQRLATVITHVGKEGISFITLSPPFYLGVRAGELGGGEIKQLGSPAIGCDGAMPRSTMLESFCVSVLHLGEEDGLSSIMSHL